MAKGKIVKRPRRKLKLSASVVFFAVVLIYFAYHLISGCFTEKLSLFEVGEPVQLTQRSTYTGLILRSETEVKAEGSGYVNYYIQEGSRAAVGDIVYSIDENGQYAKALTTGAAASTLSREHLNSLENILTKYAGKCGGMNFFNAYELEKSLENRLMSFVSRGSVRELEAMGIDVDSFTTYRAKTSGLVVYCSDGYETAQPSAIKAADFDEKTYEKTVYRSGDMVEKGAPVYKTIDSETWSIVVPLGEEDAARYAGLKRVNVYFPETGLAATALLELCAGADSGTYGVLTLSRYVIRYADTRFLKVELLMNEEEGLKIPKSALVKNTVYQIPAGYLTKGGNSDRTGFNVESGGAVQFLEVTPVDRDEASVYVSMDALAGGTVLHLPDSSETFTVGMTAESEGVYQMNKGYAVFRAVRPIREDGNYVLVEEDGPYSISTYDHILLDGSLGSGELTIY